MESKLKYRMEETDGMLSMFGYEVSKLFEALEAEIDRLELENKELKEKLEEAEKITKN